MAQRLVFLFTNELNGDDPEKYGIGPLSRMGFEVEVWILYPLLRRKPHGNQKRGTWRLFEQWGDLKKALDGLDPQNCLLVDFFMGLSALSYPSERFYRWIKKRGLRYVVPAMAALPIGPKQEENQPVAKQRSIGIFEKLRGQSWRRLRDMFSSRLIFWLRQHSELYPLPLRVFSLRNELTQYYQARTGFPSELILPFHSMEYDRFLAYKKAHPQGEAPDGTCVFLDEAFTHHPDYAVVYGHERPGTEAYLAKMIRVFEQVEAQTGLRVVVAAHPRSRYDELGDAFGGREVIQGKTQELVARSSLVLAHVSTSVSFAALFDKPLVFFWVEGAVPLTRYLYQHLNTELVDLEQPGQLEAFDFKSFLTRPRNYQDYINKYLKSDLAPPDLSCWELVGPVLKEL
ncbi:MAG: hypothetical protein RRB13_11780 [bacterium]|nr:hypothetical protein [bacterium]